MAKEISLPWVEMMIGRAYEGGFWGSTDMLKL